MISIIICSRNKDIPEQLKSNIEATIGVQYELVVIDNSKQDYSIFSAYNEGIRRASYNYLCFMHEDILYCSDDWGKKVIAHLSAPEIGLIGLAGSYYLLHIPSPWFKAKPRVKNLIQTRRPSKAPKHYTLDECKKVVCVDGFWFCSRKDVFMQIAFDEKIFNRFHFYDLDISMQIHEKGYSIYIIPDITVNHFSGGSLNKQWLESAYLFHEKWKHSLPVTVYPSLKKSPLVEVKAFRDLLYLHKKHKVPITGAIRRIGWDNLKFGIVGAYLLLMLKRLF